MNIRRRLSLAVITLGIIVSVIGCSTPTVSSPFEPVAVDQQVSDAPQPQITVPSDVTVIFPKSEVVTVAAENIEEDVLDPGNLVVRKRSTQPVPTEPVVNSPTVAPATPAVIVTPAPATPVVPATPVAPAPSGVDREVYVGLAGGQSVVDLGRGPVLFPLPAGHPPYVAEHDGDGGWARFGTLNVGMTVRMSGLVGGTYTVGQIINVPKGGSTDEFSKFRVQPKVMLQTCIPGTSRMIVVGLY